MNLNVAAIRIGGGTILFVVLTLARSFAQTDFWQQTNGPEGGLIWSAGVNPGGIVFAGAYNDIFRSTNAGQDWVPVLRGTNTSVIALFTNANGVVLAAGGTGQCWRSTDNGSSWQGFTQSSPVQAFIETSPGIFFAATLGSGVKRSSDAGATWLDSGNGLTDSVVYSLERTSNGIVLAGTSTGIFRSTNGGLLWARTFTTSGAVSDISATDGGLCFAVVQWGDVYRSTDAGVSWAALNAGLCALAVEVDHLGFVFVGKCGSGVSRSTDSGNSWSPTSLDYGYITSLSEDSSVGIFVTDQGWGIHRSVDNGQTWQLATAGLVASVTSLLCASTVLNEIWSGVAYSRRVFRSSDRGINWQPSTLNASEINRIVFKPGGKVFASGYGFYRSTDNGNSWVERVDGLPQYSRINTAVVAQNSALLLAVQEGFASSSIWYSSNDGDNWVTTGMVLPYTNHLLVTRSGSIIAGTGTILSSLRGVYRSTDNGFTWVASGLSGKNIFGLAQDSTGNLYAGTDGPGSIYLSMDDGITWSPRSSGLPSAQDVVTVSANSSGYVFAGFGRNDITPQLGGVYRSTDRGSSWVQLNDGLTNKVVILSAIDSEGFLTVGTEGSGVFRSLVSTVVQSSAHVVLPNGNEQWPVGSIHNIAWSSTNIVNMKIELSTDNGITWPIMIANNTPASAGMYSWTVPNTPSTECRIRISDALNPSISDVSDAPFVIGLIENIPILKPASGELWIAGEDTVIAWTGTTATLVDISLSLDGGSTFQEIAHQYPASSGEHRWSIPRNILSRKSKIRITDSQNPFSQGTSDIFRIKGYELTRVTAAGDYELYQPNPFGWQFENKADELWPSTWWSGFDYEAGLDPYTTRAYPSSWTSFFGGIHAKPEDFPDWPLFVKTFGVNQCYLGDSQASLGYLPETVEIWAHRKGGWIGSCYGLALASFLAFDNKERFSSEFGLPQFGDLHDLTTTDPSNGNTIRSVVNQLWIHQWGNAQLQRRCRKSGESPIEMLAELKGMLLSESGANRILNFAYTGINPGGHSVNPYRIETASGNPNIEYVYVYDNNHPDVTTMRLLIDKSSGLWHYPDLGWAGSANCYLELPSENFYHAPILQIKSECMESLSDGASTGVLFFATPNARIGIFNQAGQGIGYVDSVFSTIPSGVPIIPFTGYPHPPIGYYVKSEPYSIRMSSYSDSSMHFASVADTTMFIYYRSGVDTAQSDRISYKRDGIRIENADPQTKTVNLKTVMVRDTSAQKVFSVLNCPILQEDTIQMDALNGQSIRLTNIGSEKHYDLSLRIVSSDSKQEFEHRDITLGNKSAQTIAPRWNTLSTSDVDIYIDDGNDGTIDDSISIQNQITGGDAGLQQPLPNENQLLQNYPNPFNALTTLRYTLSKRSMVTLAVFNTLGQQVATLVQGEKEAGYHEVQLDGSGLSSGVYFYRMTAGDYVSTKKLLLLK